MQTDVDRLKQLRRLGREEKPEDRKTRWESASGLEAKAELARLEEVEKVIGGLSRRLERAARNDADYCRLVSLDGSAYSGDPSYPEPCGLEHLHSEAHQRLWKHLEGTPFTPFIYPEVVCSTANANAIARYWIAVRLPGLEAAVAVPAESTVDRAQGDLRVAPSSA